MMTNGTIDPALNVYQRLQQNAEAMGVVSQATGSAQESFKDCYEALSLTLDDKAIVPRRWVSAARRELARREKQESGGDAE